MNCNRVDPDETAHYELDLHCLHSWAERVKALIITSKADDIDFLSFRENKACLFI